MSKNVQMPGGPTVQENLKRGLPRQIRMDTTRNELRVHDGITPGGHRIPNEAGVAQMIAQSLSASGASGTLAVYATITDLQEGAVGIGAFAVLSENGVEDIFLWAPGEGDDTTIASSIEGHWKRVSSSISWLVGLYQTGLVDLQIGGSEPTTGQDRILWIDNGGLKLWNGVAYVAPTPLLFSRFLRMTMGSANPGDMKLTRSNVVPYGWLDADGSLVEVVDYPDLVAFTWVGSTANATAEDCYRCDSDGTRNAAGTHFKLPEWRGEFFRGLDLGRGVDADRVLGSAQSDQNKAHTHNVTIDSGGAHNHTASSANAGSHTHTGTAASAGAHTHGGSTGSDGGHTHTGSATSNGAHTHSVSGTAASNGNHSHTIVSRIGSTGSLTNNGSGGNSADSGNVTTNTTGSHTHSVSGTAASNGAHTHTLSINSVGDHTHTISSDGAHTHSVSTVAAGTHNHTITVDTGGAHTHTGSTSSNGGTESRPRNIALRALIKW